MIDRNRVLSLLKQDESLRLEFKQAYDAIPENVYETICSMLNRDGGDIFLGVSDSGEIIGIKPGMVSALTQNVIDSTNNPQKLNPPFLLQPIVHNIDGKSIMQLQVPASSQVHRTNKGIFDRSREGDYLLKEPFLISEMYNRKRNYYTEGIIYPQAGIDALSQKLFTYARALIKSNNPNHPWLILSDIEILKISGLYRKDIQSGIEGITLAAILLLGKDETISSVLPHYKTDLLLRQTDVERYDDREYIQTNLLDAFDFAMAFISKHLPDKPYYEGTQRISLRANIFREVIGNLLIHREYTNALPARLILYKDRMETINAHNRHGEGAIQISNYSPYPKNPLISKFFIQLGRAEELGSGIIRINRYLPLYSKGSVPSFIEGDTFNTILPLDRVFGILRLVEPKSDGDTKESEGDTVITEGDILAIDGDRMGALFNATLFEKGIKLAKVCSRQKCFDLLMSICRHEGNSALFYRKELNVSQSSIERYLKVLNQAGFIEIKGLARASRYHLTDSFRHEVLPI